MSEPTRRLVALDVLRAVAVLLVLGRHFPTGLAPLEPAFVQGALETWVRGGWVGVDLFFVLSGFLVSGLLFRQHQRHGRLFVRRFLLRRGLRIYPPFYALMAVTIGVCLAYDLPLEPRNVVGELVYLQNYVGALWGHTWTLAIEEHFYLALPLFLLLVIDRRGRLERLPKACLLIVGVCLAARLSLIGVPYTMETHMTQTHLRIDSLLCGVLIAYYYHYRPALFASLSRWRAPLAVGGALLIAVPFVWELSTSRWLPVVVPTLLYLGFGAWLLVALDLQLTDRVSRALASLGEHSYSIYLWHFGVMLVVERLGVRRHPEVSAWAWLALYFVGSLVVGVLFAKLLELPILRLRDRLFPRRAGSILDVSRVEKPNDGDADTES